MSLLFYLKQLRWEVRENEAETDTGQQLFCQSNCRRVVPSLSVLCYWHRATRLMYIHHRWRGLVFSGSVTDLLRLTIAQGIPVGVLKAGSSFSASCTAFSLNTWRETEWNIRQRERLNCKIGSFWFTWNILQETKSSCLTFFWTSWREHKATTTKNLSNKNKCRQRWIKQRYQEANNSQKTMFTRVKAEQIYGDRQNNVCKTLLWNCAAVMWNLAEKHGDVYRKSLEVKTHWVRQSDTEVHRQSWIFIIMTGV